MEEQEFSPLVRAVGVIDENRNFIPYGSTMVAKGIPVFVFDTKEEYDQHAPTLPEPCVVITLDDIDTGGFEFDAAIDPESENAVQNKVIAAALEALRDKANFDRPGMVQFTDSPTVTDRNSGLGLSAIEKNASVEGTIAHNISNQEKSLASCAKMHPRSLPNMIVNFMVGDHNLIHLVFEQVPAVPATCNFSYIVTSEGRSVRSILAIPIDYYENRIFIYRWEHNNWSATEPITVIS